MLHAVLYGRAVVASSLCSVAQPARLTEPMSFGPGGANASSAAQSAGDTWNDVRPAAQIEVLNSLRGAVLNSLRCSRGRCADRSAEQPSRRNAKQPAL